MAVQYQVAHSSSVVGSGIVAGGPYYCAGTTLLTNAALCMGMIPFFPPNAALSVIAAQGFATAGQIDPLSDLQKDRIYVFSGTNDSVVRQQSVNSTAASSSKPASPMPICCTSATFQPVMRC